MGVSPDCIAAVQEASGGAFTPAEAEAVIRRVEARRDALAAAGRLDNLDRRLAELAAADAEAVKRAAALARKHAALNAIVRDRLDAVLAAHIGDGMEPAAAMLALFEGVNRNLENGRLSVASLVDAFEGRYVGDLTAALDRAVPHWQKRMRSRPFQDAIVREMRELGEGGEPGRHGDPDAAKVAKVFALYSELARRDLNARGADIGKLDGWAGPQSYDPRRMLDAGEEAWTADMLAELDLARTFPELKPDEVREVLHDIWLTITTGRDNSVTARERGEFAGPANVARAVSRNRVLHYRDADAWLRINGKYSEGHIFGAIAGHQMRAARLAAQMQMFGPNPEVMIGSLLEGLQRRVRNDPSIPANKKEGLISNLSLRNRAMASALAEMQGLHSTVADGKRTHTAASIASAVRAVFTMAKLGSSVFAQISDLGQNAAQLRYNGVPLGKSYVRQVHAVLRSMAGVPAEQRELGHLLGVAFNGVIDDVAARFNVDGGVPGRMTRAVNGFMKLVGMTGLQNALERANGLVLSAHAGRELAKPWGQVNASLKAQLRLYGLGEAEWGVLAQGDYRTAQFDGLGDTDGQGGRYLTGDRIREIPAEAMDALLGDEIAAATERAHMRGRSAAQGPSADLTPAQARWLDRWLEQRRVTARDELELKVRAWQVDAAHSGVIRPSARSRRWMLQGTQRGTALGEALRFFGQFKGFPVAFTERGLGQALFGPSATAGTRAVTIAHMLAATTVAGYLTMTVYDFLSGYEPRDPTDPRTWLAAFTRGGGAGIYGDFLFGQANFAVGPWEALGGPFIGESSKLIRLWWDLRQGEATASEVFRGLTSNIPFQNLWWARTALDVLVLNELREAMSPGTIRRWDERRERDFGQERVVPASVWR